MKRLLAAAALATVVLGIVATPAQAAQVTIREVDTTKWPTVRLVVLADGHPAPEAFNVRDGDVLISDLAVGDFGKSAARVGTVLAIDESASMAAAGRIEAAKVAANAFVERLRPNEEIAVVAFSTTSRVVSPLSADKAVLHAAISGLQAHGETALWDGVQMAAGLLQARPDLQPNIIVLSDGKDTKSTSSAPASRATVLAAKAVVFGIGLGGGVQDLPDPDGLAALSSASGGLYSTAADVRALPDVYGQLQQTLQGQYELTFRATGSDARHVTVSVNGKAASASVVPGGVAQGINTKPSTVNPPRVPGFLSGVLGKFIIFGLVLGAAALLVRAVVMTVSRPLSKLDSALIPYGEQEGHLDPDAELGMSLVETQFVKSAVDRARRFAPAQRIFDSLRIKLETANVPLRAEEVAFVYGTVAFLALALAIVFMGPIIAVAVAVGLTFLPVAVLAFLTHLRQSRFTKQLPDALNLLSGTLRAGFSLMQGIEAMASEVGDPMGVELRRVLAEARLGRPLDGALSDMATRLRSPDFEWTVMAIGIQREVGGNLAELLENVSETMRARERLRRDVKALTAEGRMSAIVIGIMPPALGAVMWVANRAYIEVLFKDSMGQMILAGSGLLAMFGFWWMKKTIEIEV